VEGSIGDAVTAAKVVEVTLSRFSARGNLVAFYEVIAADETRWLTAAERCL
jgi:hypothetical protein